MTSAKKTEPKDVAAVAKPSEAKTPAHPASAQPVPAAKVPETGGPAGPEPTRYGDWERKGRCIDF